MVFGVSMRAVRAVGATQAVPLVREALPYFVIMATCGTCACVHTGNVVTYGLSMYWYNLMRMARALRRIIYVWYEYMTKAVQIRVEGYCY